MPYSQDENDGEHTQEYQLATDFHNSLFSISIVTLL